LGVVTNLTNFANFLRKQIVKIFHIKKVEKKKTMSMSGDGEIMDTLCWMWQTLVDAQIGSGHRDALILLNFCSHFN